MARTAIQSLRATLKTSVANGATYTFIDNLLKDIVKSHGNKVNREAADRMLKDLFPQQGENQ